MQSNFIKIDNITLLAIIKRNGLVVTWQIIILIAKRWTVSESKFHGDVENDVFQRYRISL